MKLVNSQKGMSLFGWLMLLVVVGFLASTVFKMLPHYLDYMSFEKIIGGVEKEASRDIRSIDGFYAHVANGMMINNIRDTNPKDILEVSIEGDEFIAHLKYEKRETMIGNLDLVARFDKEFRVRMP